MRTATACSSPGSTDRSITSADPAANPLQAAAEVALGVPPSPNRGRRTRRRRVTVERGTMRRSNRLKPLLAGLPFGPLVEREFRLLFIGRTISLFGSAFAPIALAFAVITLTGSPADLGYVLSAYMLAHLVFLLAGGVWADRLPRHLVMVASDLLSGVSQITFAVLLLTGVAQTWQLIFLAAVKGGASAFFMP